MTDSQSAECTCPCGESRFSVTGKPLLRALCHCTICQSFNENEQADICIFPGSRVELPANHPVDFQAYRKPPAVQRGRCSFCGKPAIEFLRLPVMPDVVFVPTANMPESLVPEPSLRIFYDSRVKDAEDSLPRYEGYWPSQLAFMRCLLTSALTKKA